MFSSPHVVIQRIHITWTKASRGGEGARWRHSLPHALPLPLTAFAAPFSYHRANFSESAKSSPAEQFVRGKSFTDLGIRDLNLSYDGNVLVVQLIHDGYNAAVDRRRRYNRDAFSLTSDEWGKLQYNGRYVDFDTGNWWYEQSIYNIGVFSDVATARFIVIAPDRRYSELARLR